MRNSTLLFPMIRDKKKVTEICLAMKKRGFGAGRWNGAGGKVMAHESIEDGARREAAEEIGIVAKNLSKVAELTFVFPEKPEWNQLVHAYFCETWEGTPSESEEMAPRWFKVDSIPFDKMWPDDILWLPKAIAGKLIKAEFAFNGKDEIVEQSLETVKSLNS